MGISLLLNAVLLTTAGVMGINRLHSIPAPPPVPPAPPVAAGEPHRESVETFRWSQIESSDYRRYIANLRMIECPEQTIRDLITADVASLYAQKRKETQAQWLESGAGANALQQAMEKLSKAETELVASLLCPQNPVSSEATSKPAAESGRESPGEAPSTPADAISQAAEEKVSMPVIFFEPGPEVQLSEDQRERLGALRKEFIQEIGGSGQNPSDPNYRQKWAEAQQKFDQQFQVIMGKDAYLQLSGRANGYTGQQQGKP